jgi:predicted RNA-binding Zn ribbon-like protein
LECNKSTDKDDEYFRLISVDIQASIVPAAQHATDATLRALQRRQARGFQKEVFSNLQPVELLSPPAADLICGVDFRLIRACEGSVCTLLFLDRTKAHGRRWCSMAACGNRAKAAAHRARKRNR